MLLPTIGIATDAKRDDLNDIFELIEQGRPFSVKLCAINPSATYETPPTHWLFSHMSAQSEDVAVWQAMADGEGTLPEIEAEWGDGIISDVDPQAAIGVDNIRIFTDTGAIDAPGYAILLNAALTAMGLQKVPDEPV